MTIETTENTVPANGVPAKPKAVRSSRIRNANRQPRDLMGDNERKALAADLAPKVVPLFRKADKMQGDARQMAAFVLFVNWQTPLIAVEMAVSGKGKAKTEKPTGIKHPFTLTDYAKPKGEGPKRDDGTPWRAMETAMHVAVFSTLFGIKAADIKGGDKTAILDVMPTVRGIVRGMSEQRKLIERDAKPADRARLVHAWDSAVQFQNGKLIVPARFTEVEPKVTNGGDKTKHMKWEATANVPVPVENMKAVKSIVAPQKRETAAPKTADQVRDDNRAQWDKSIGFVLTAIQSLGPKRDQAIIAPTDKDDAAITALAVAVGKYLASIKTDAKTDSVKSA